MSRATPQMRALSKRLVAHELRGNKSSAVFQVCERLRLHLAMLMGNGGFRALFLRALAVAREEVSWLHSVKVQSDGSLEGLDEVEAQVNPEQMAEGCLVLVAQLLELLMAFIGEDLTLRMVREVWPKLSVDDLDFGKGDKK